MMNFLAFILVFFSTKVLCIFDDELNKIDWIHQQIGSFVSDPIISNRTIFGITDANLFVALSTVDDSILFRYDVYESPRLVEYKGRLAVGSWQDDVYHLKFYSRDGGNTALVQTIFFERQVVELINLDDSKLLIVFANGELVALDSNYKMTYTGITISNVANVKISVFDDKIVIADGDEIEIYNQDFILLKNLKSQGVNDLKSSKILSNGNVYDVCHLKMSKVVSGKVDLINEYGYLTAETDGVLQFHSYGSELIYQSPPAILHYILNGDHMVIFGNVSIKVIDLETGVVIDTIGNSIDLKGTNRVIYKDGKVLVNRPNGLIEFYHYGELKWCRDESLSKIKSFVILDEVSKTLLITEKEILKEENSSLLSAYGYRLAKTVARLFPNSRSNRIDKDEEFKLNYFGLNKILIVLTELNKLFAFSIDKKKLLWDLQLINEYTKIVKSPSKDGEFYLLDLEGKMVNFDSNGEILKQGSFNINITKIHEIDGLILLQTSSLEIIPLENQDIVVDNKYFIENDGNSVYGLKISQNRVQRTWSIPLDANEEILSVVKRDDANNDAIASIGVVLGDRRVLYKYLVPNLAVLSIYDDVEESLKLKLINILTGEILAVVKHELEFIDRHSFELIFDENFIVYKYFSFVPTLEQKIVVVDLFESLEPDEHTSSGDGVASSQFDAKSIIPETASRSFNFPMRIDKIISTKTRYNIATKNILLLLENGEIVSIPKFILNGRRPYEELSPVEKEESMMFRYESDIPINDKFVLTNIHRLKLRDNLPTVLVSVPTNLESTTIICLLNLDFYCTRLSPSGEFDVLSHGFGKLPLIGTILMLFVGVFVVRPIVDKKRLNSRWVVQ